MQNGLLWNPSATRWVGVGDDVIVFHAEMHGKTCEAVVKYIVRKDFNYASRTGHPDHVAQSSPVWSNDNAGSRKQLHLLRERMLFRTENLEPFRPEHLFELLFSS